MDGARSFQSLRDILPRTLNDLGLGDRLRRERTFAVFAAALQDTCPTLAGRVAPVAMEQGMLTVRAADAEAASEMQRWQVDLLHGLQERLTSSGIPRIDQLRITR